MSTDDADHRAKRLAALIAERFGKTSTFVTQAHADATDAGRSADIGDARITHGDRRAIGH